MGKKLLQFYAENVCLSKPVTKKTIDATVLPAKSDSDVMFCL